MAKKPRVSVHFPVEHLSKDQLDEVAKKDPILNRVFDAYRFVNDSNKLSMIHSLERVCMAYRCLRRPLPKVKNIEPQQRVIKAHIDLYDVILKWYGPAWSGVFDRYVSTELDTKKSGLAQYKVAVKLKAKIAILDHYLDDAHPAIAKAIGDAKGHLSEQIQLLEKYSSSTS